MVDMPPLPMTCWHSTVVEGLYFDCESDSILVTATKIDCDAHVVEGVEGVPAGFADKLLTKQAKAVEKISKCKDDFEASMTERAKRLLDQQRWAEEHLAYLSSLDPITGEVALERDPGFVPQPHEGDLVDPLQ